MRDVLSTAGLIFSIFVLITVMLTGPKGFSLAADKPVVSSVAEAAND